MPLPAWAPKGFAPPKVRKDAVAWIVVALFAALMAGVYFELQKKSGALQSLAAAKRAQIRTARESGLADIGAAELARLQNGIAAFQGGFIRTAELPAVLDGLSEEAERNQVRVVSVDSAPPSAEQELPASETDAGAPAYRRLPIHMRLEGTTRSIGSFLRSLEKSSKRLFVVEKLRLTKRDAKAPTLDCELTLSFFSNGAGG
ncbi:MAG TPA: GspMb/PilO family protein [Candidatus Eisenbacteria bacterium]|nr:GspMb/PilO family protein [Candidatus Eisenbacteria bacterium]